jgi:hypothetical protein
MRAVDADSTASEYGQYDSEIRGHHWREKHEQ